MGLGDAEVAVAGGSHGQVDGLLDVSLDEELFDDPPAPQLVELELLRSVANVGSLDADGHDELAVRLVLEVAVV